MNYIIGDIHGEISKLKSLIKKIRQNETNPSFIFLGDYIDKGENSKKTLDYLIRLKDKYPTIFLMGNHEQYWLKLNKYKNLILKYGGIKTLENFGFKTIEKCQKQMISQYSEIFDHLKGYHETEKYLICHSGIPSKMFNSDYTNKINLDSFLFNRYDFIKEKRFFKKKKKIIFGHTAFFSPYVDNFKIGIDTGACYLKDQPLTSFCLEKQIFIDSKHKTYNLEDIKFNSCPVIIR